MPAYVPNYKHDLFVSYAHVDNRPRIRGDVDSMWVTTFTNQLRIVISQKLGRSDLDDSTFLPEAEAEADADIDALGRSMDPTFQPILDRLNALSGQLADFREGVSQSIKVAEVDPEMALTRTRKVLERLIHAVYNRQIKTSPGTQPLEGLLQRLRKDGFLPSKIYAHATAVKDLGNVGAHSHAEHVSPADVVHSLTALLYVLEWYSEEEPDPAGEVPLPKPTRQPTVEGPAPAIEQAISSAATLLVILSEGHLQSERCRRELDMFLQARGGIEAARGRIFVAARDEIERSRWPVEFQDLIGYEFYEKTAEGRVHTLAVPKLTPDEELYFTRLDDISMDLVQRLKQLAHGFSPGSPQAASAPASTTAYSGCVFLGDVIPELDSTREEVKRHLMHVNLRVLPETFYSRTPSDYRAALERDLGEADLFVQLLGTVPEPQTDDFPHGFSGLQLERCLSLQKPILRWRDPNLDLNAIADADHRRELADKAAAMDLETFKKEIEKHVRSSLVKPVAHETEGDYFVLVNANEDDMEVADNISDKLDENHLGYYVATESIDELSEEDDYDALMVVYGSCSSSWVTEQVRLCRRVMLKKKLNPPVCAVYFGPPDEKERLRCKPPKMLEFRDSDGSSLERFIAAVRSRRQEG